MANIRGGGEFGPAWHDAALKTNRQRAYDDFEAVAADLARRGLTTPKQLGIMGGSNGGLLVSTVMVQRPELFGAVVCQVPLIDMIAFTHIGAGASWIGEYGDPAIPAERDYIGRAALEARRTAGGLSRFVGLLLTGRGVLRAHQRVLVGGHEAGITTSGGYAPSLQRSIALARLAPGIALASGDRCEVDIRGKPTAARLVKPPFVRQGTIRIDLD